MNKNKIILKVNERILIATLEKNSSTKALLEILKKRSVILYMKDYGNMEKVGDLVFSLPTNNEKITTEAGDLILYQGSYFVIYYEQNSWNFTKLGKITNITSNELKEILGNGDVKVELSLSN